ncbi:MAG: hypothetical protein WEE89_20525 [Gemmatimonadota bacterium]
MADPKSGQGGQQNDRTGQGGKQTGDHPGQNEPRQGQGTGNRNTETDRPGQGGNRNTEPERKGTGDRTTQGDQGTGRSGQGGGQQGR